MAVGKHQTEYVGVMGTEELNQEQGMDTPARTGEKQATTTASN